MALLNYTDLQSAMSNWLDQTLFSARYPDLITLFEAYANRRLRVRQMETSTTLVPSSGSVALPTDYLSWRRVTDVGAVLRELEYVHPSYIKAAYPSAPSAPPSVFTIEGSTLKIMPTDSTAIDFSYFQKIPALSASNADNWLLLAHPDAYLFGALAEAELFGVNDQRAALWASRKDEIMGEIERLSNKTRGVGPIKIMGVTP